MDPNIDEALIKKEMIHPGSKYIPLTNGTRVSIALSQPKIQKIQQCSIFQVKFHYQTRKCDENRTLIDDSKKTGKPMELVLGKKFKLEVWEVIVQKMALNEVAKFTVDKSLVLQYPFVSKTIRDAARPQEERKHCCGMTIQNEGIGYKDLDDIFTKPCDLEFILELISIELPEQYQKDSWQLNDDEKLVQIQELKDKGNQAYKEKDIKAAETSYSYAIGMVEQLMLKLV
jgi:AH receptor-interacting protein